MIKRMLPLLIGLSVCGTALAQNMPAAAQSTSSTTTTKLITWPGQPPMGGSTEEAVKTAIANAGYKEVKDLKFKDGV